MNVQFRRVRDMQFVTTGGKLFKTTTVGFWAWTKTGNKGTLIIQCAAMQLWRHELAVFGHECIEAIYCWLLGITTEQCDAWDAYYEREYDSGRISKEIEAGDDPRCPYHWGHMAGVVWEYLCIYATFGSWKKYSDECNHIMGITGEGK